MSARKPREKGKLRTLLEAGLVEKGSRLLIQLALLNFMMLGVGVFMCISTALSQYYKLLVCTAIFTGLTALSLFFFALFAKRSAKDKYLVLQRILGIYLGVLCVALTTCYFLYGPASGMNLFWIAALPVILFLCYGVFPNGLLLIGVILVESLLFLYVPYFAHLGEFPPDLADEAYQFFRREFVSLFVVDTVVGIITVLLYETSIKHAVELRDQYSKAAFTDALTGIPNQSRFIQYAEEIGGEVKPGDDIYVFFIDIDNFKSFNDRFGHFVGNDILVSVSQKLTEATKSLVACWGGDEFVIVEINKPRDEIVNEAKFIRRSVQSIVHPAIEEQPISVSIGVSHHVVGTEFSFSQIIKEADEQLSKSKKIGKNYYSIEDF